MSVANYKALYVAVSTRFKEQLVDTGDIAASNVSYDNDAMIEPAMSGVWCRVSVRTNNSDQTEYGTQKRFRITGVLFVQVFSPINQGDAEALALADKIDVAFKSLNAGGVRYFTPSITPIGRDLSWWQINITCPFKGEIIT